MQGSFLAYALLTGLATALLVAGFTDLRRRQIDN
jgi:prepilin peptidase CpaA